MNAAERREFVRTRRTAIFGFDRVNGPPSMTVVYYVMDDNGDLLVSTMAARAKAKAVERTGEVSLCVLDEQWPLTYVLVYGTARLDPDFDKMIDVMLKVGEIMAGQPLPDEARPMAEAMAKAENRVLIRISATATFHSPPVHLKRATREEAEKMQHGLGAVIAW